MKFFFTQTAHITQKNNCTKENRRTNLQILNYKKYLCPPPPFEQMYVHDTNPTLTYEKWGAVETVMLSLSNSSLLQSDDMHWKTDLWPVSRIIVYLRCIYAPLQQGELAFIFWTIWRNIIATYIPVLKKEKFNDFQEIFTNLIFSEHTIVT